jgi:hypothetical protein
MKGTRIYNSCASRDVRASSLRRRDSGYFSAGFYQSVSSESCTGPFGENYADHWPASTEPPFDRHDWIVRRPSTGEEIRYVIDYYGAPPLPDGSPVFSLDVRPALDDLGSISMRVRAATREAWAKATPEATSTHA